MVFQATELTNQEIALPAQFPLLLLLGRGDADGFELVAAAAEIAGEPVAKLACVHAVVLAAPVVGQAHGRGDQGLDAGGQEGVVEGVAEAAGFVDGVDSVAGLDLGGDPLEELGAGPLLGKLDGAAVALDGGDDEVEVDVDAELEDVGLGRRGGAG